MVTSSSILTSTSPMISRSSVSPSRSIKRVVVSAGLIRAADDHPQRGKILMTRRLADVHLAGSWEFPGGKVEIGEDPVAALQRELNEELGIEVSSPQIYSVGHHLYERAEEPDEAKDVILLVFDCQLTSGEPQCLGVSSFAWLTPSEVCELPLPPADEDVLRRLRLELVTGSFI